MVVKNNNVLSMSEKGAKNISHKKLPEEFTKNEVHYKMVKRINNYAIYKTTQKSGKVFYDTIKIDKHNGFKIGEKVTEPSEYYPALLLLTVEDDPEFTGGIGAWRFKSAEEAEKQLQSITQ